MKPTDRRGTRRRASCSPTARSFSATGWAASGVRGRRAGLQHRDHRLPGDPDRSLLRRPDRSPSPFRISATSAPTPRTSKRYHLLRPRHGAARADHRPLELAQPRSISTAGSTARGIAAIAGVDTRRITRILRETGAQNAALAYHPRRRARPGGRSRPGPRAWPGLEGMDLATEVSCRQRYAWDETAGPGATATAAATATARTWWPSTTASSATSCARSPASAAGSRWCRRRRTAEEVLALGAGRRLPVQRPGRSGGHRRATRCREIRKLVDSGKPLFGICLGHQMLALALGGTHREDAVGHHGANHPVKDLTTGKVEITSQNHGFAVADDGLPAERRGRPTARCSTARSRASALKDRPVFSVQYHPEASPGPAGQPLPVRPRSWCRCA